MEGKARRGISLIVLVITILVMIILAGVVVVTMSENNPINKAKEAKFKSNVSAYKEELGMFHAKETAKGTYAMRDLNADKQGITYVGGSLDVKGNISNIITGMQDKKDLDIFSVMAGELVYVGKDREEMRWCQELGLGSASFVDGVNTPKLSSGMVPVYLEGNVWKKADASNVNNSWYNYETKMWANAVTLKKEAREKYTNAAVGTTILDADINMFLVWIPRYAYSIKGNAYRNIVANSSNVIDVKFLKGTTCQDASNKVYARDYDALSVKEGEATPMIVHPAFRFGSIDVPGIWVSKFEVSGTPNADGKYPGNSYKATTPNAVGDYPYELNKYAKDTIIQSIPGVPTLRQINVYTFAKLTQDTLTKSQKELYGTENMDIHMLKNTEWGAVEYLASSTYGVIPSVNSELKKVTWKIDGGKNAEAMVDVIAGSSDYIANASQSTTGNPTGVYDMNGGAWEYTLGYLVNGFEYRGIYGEKIDSIDAKYKDIYSATEEEKNNKIQLADGSFVTREELAERNADANVTRKRLADANMQFAASVKGDGVYETTKKGNYSYFGKAANDTEAWLSAATGIEHIREGNWDKDASCFFGGSRTYMVRGSLGLYGETSGIHTYLATFGFAGSDAGFRLAVI